MKAIYNVIFALFLCSAFAQPTAEMIRESIAAEIMSMQIDAEPIFKAENTTVENIKIRIYSPSAANHLPIIYNIHGGALVGGNLDTHENISRKLANSCNSIVIAVDYRKPPENPYPAGVDDTYEVYKWMASKYKTPITLVSDSGGCLLAAALQIQIRNSSAENRVTKAVYINPAFDLRNPEGDFYQLITQWYLSGADPNKELISPMVTKDFSVFAPALILVSEKDVLRPHGTDFGNKLTAAGIKNEVIEIPNEDHFGRYWAAAHPKINFPLENVLKFLKS